LRRHELTPSTAELLAEPLVDDAARRETALELAAVVLRMAARGGEAANVGKRLHAGRFEQRCELVERACRVPGGIDGSFAHEDGGGAAGRSPLRPPLRSSACRCE